MKNRKRRKAGLYLHTRGNIYHIGGTIHGKSIRRSTRTDDLEIAELILANTIKDESERYKCKITGVYPVPTFAELSDIHLNGPQLKSIDDDDLHIRKLSAYIGDLPYNEIRRGTDKPLEQFIIDQAHVGNSRRTINMALEVINKMGNKALREWTRPEDPDRMMLEKFIPIKLVNEESIAGVKLKPKRKPYPLSWDEQTRLFRELPDYLRDMATFKVNTGTRHEVVRNLKWEWLRKIPDSSISVFIVPEDSTKNTNPDNKREHIVILNSIAKDVIERQKRKHPVYVFTRAGAKVKRMNGLDWQNARNKAYLPQVRVHDLKHTFGARLRHHGVPESDIEWLLNHKSSNTISTHYSSPSLEIMARHIQSICQRTRLTLMPTLDSQNQRTA